MSNAGKLKERLRAVELRKRGVSVREIQKILGVSRSSVSLWTRDVVLTEAQQEALIRRMKVSSYRGSLAAAAIKKERREQQERDLLVEGRQRVGSLTNRDMFIAGVALYFAEGDKRSNHVAFSNSDSSSISFMMRWFRTFAKVPKSKYRLYLYLHDHLDEVAARKYWSRVTKLPLSSFGKTYRVATKAQRFRKTTHQHGVLRISISDVVLLRRIKGWIFGLLGANIPVGQMEAVNIPG